MKLPRLSVRRIGALMAKEMVQMRRDRLTFAMMFGIPLVQLALFGFAINTNPRHLPTLLEAADNGPVTRSIVRALENSDYFEITGISPDAEASAAALRSGEATFIVAVPPNFETDAAAGAGAQILLDADATDPSASSAPVAAFAEIVTRASMEALGAAAPAPGIAPVEPVVHRRYNPEGRTATNIVPGLLGIILTMTMAMFTALSLTREAESGTLETLLASPAAPIEVMVGKIMPFVAVGAMQTFVMLMAARFVFAVPFNGDFIAFALAVSLFVLTNLAIGFLFSTVARTQMQAMQMTFFYFLPSILLSGFMFPFRGMPDWAQTIGQALPTTHFIRVVRATMLKEAGFPDVGGDLIPLVIILLVVGAAAMARYRRTLD